MRGRFLWHRASPRQAGVWPSAQATRSAATGSPAVRDYDLRRQKDAAEEVEREAEGGGETSWRRRLGGQVKRPHPPIGRSVRFCPGPFCPPVCEPVISARGSG